MNCDGRYENGNPPYSLYQGEDGLWGLVDKDGTRLPAVFKRLDEDRFQEKPWEVMSFNPEEGFELFAWFDPCDVWFNFTWDDARYPAEFGAYLWARCDKSFVDYEACIRGMLPDQSHWLLHCINEVGKIEASVDDEEERKVMVKLLSDYSQLANAADFNHLLDPVMRDVNVLEDIKIALWQAKVMLDESVRRFMVENQQLD